jgi:hypothetical protein
MLAQFHCDDKDGRSNLPYKPPAVKFYVARNFPDQHSSSFFAQSAVEQTQHVAVVQQSALKMVINLRCVTAQLDA